METIKKSAKKALVRLFALPFPLLIDTALTGCDCEDCHCNEIAESSIELQPYQKDFGNIGQKAPRIYRHDQGTEIRFSVQDDTTFWTKRQDFCYTLNIQTREVKWVSEYPVVKIDLTMDASYLSISYKDWNYYLPLDSTGFLRNSYSEDFEILDSLQIDSVSYKDVAKITVRTKFKTDSLGNLIEDLSHAYFHETFGLLKIETSDSNGITLVRQNPESKK